MGVSPSGAHCVEYLGRESLSDLTRRSTTRGAGDPLSRSCAHLLASGEYNFYPLSIHFDSRLSMFSKGWMASAFCGSSSGIALVGAGVVGSH